ncbi:hypothetical protein C8R41DRAFT_840720 [Lentinula lateritia]|uniref:Uncharacterized protein n=1 Tax=Lentinula lateritia TaxID=40482 RepID=A0ABQ8V9Z2_9AGAR|nr:hypothetical protein C8R41DRAFT_840720 [Lentinula lateritia]
MVAIIFRAESESTPTASSTPTSSSITSASTSTSSASSTGTDPDPATNALTKNVLEWIFLALVVIFVSSVVHRRLHALTRNGLPIRSFFSARNVRTPSANPRPSRPFPSTFSSSLSAYDLANVPTAYNPFATIYSSTSPSNRTRNPTRAADIDSGGRRLGEGPSDYHNGFGDRKDTLPAYDKHGSPPGYIASLPVLPSSGSAGEDRRNMETGEDAPNYTFQELRDTP